MLTAIVILALICMVFIEKAKRLAAELQNAALKTILFIAIIVIVILIVK
jgi:hypothetical protein